MSWAERLAALEEFGLNAVGVADGGPWQQVLPECRAVVVVGSGGGALWRSFLSEIRRSPEALTEELHPLDAHVARILTRIDPEPGPDRRWIRCAADAEVQLDFRTLALGAGLGFRSRLGLLLHPRYGPWLGLRAACFTTEALPVSGPLGGAPPCEACPAPCAAACPAGAVQRGPFELGRCLGWRQQGRGCAETCHSRLACPIGAEHRYDPLELHYHSDQGTGRPALEAAVGRSRDGWRASGKTP